MPRSNHSKPDELADAFAAALTLKHKHSELITGDLEFKSVEKEIKINWLK